MIHGFLNSKIVSAEEYLIDYSIRTGQSIHIPTDLLNMPIVFDGNDINAFILDITSNNELVLQLVLPIREKFDDKSNVYKTSYIRNLLNSDKFLSRFNKEFVDHINPTIIHTENYTTEDKFWLLSHEEIDLANTIFLKRNKTCKSFDAFKHIELKSYSETLLKLNKQNCRGWRLRSASSNTSNKYRNRFVGIVYHGYMSGCERDDVATLRPVCTIG